MPLLTENPKATQSCVPTYKKLGLAREELSDGDLIRLMVEEPRLIRRPLIRVGDELIVGSDRNALERAIP